MIEHKPDDRPGQLDDHVVRDASSLIRTRHRAQTRRRTIRWAIIVLVVLVIGGGIWSVWFSPWFVARSVQVTGNPDVTTDQVVDAAQISLGTPLVRLDTAAIRQRVMQLPVVADAHVTRKLNGVVQIAVTERTAVYALAAGSGSYLLVDHTGTGYLSVSIVPSGLPVVNVANDGSDLSKRLMSDAATIVQALPQSVTDQMVSMQATTPDNFTVTMKNGSQIMWGSADESAQKAEVIDGLLKVSASYYDVSSPSHPATR